jgi:hypothetical protein
VLEGDHITAGLRPVLAGETQPPWLSDPLVTVRPHEADMIAGGTGDDPEASTLPAAALYAVCLADDDERCAS